MKYRKDEMEKELERVVNRTKTVEEAVREIIFFFSNISGNPFAYCLRFGRICGRCELF